MNLLLDTNILLYIARDKSSRRIIRFINPTDVIVYVSFTSIAEIESIALQQRWGNDKKNRVEFFLDNVRVIDITDLILKNYVDLDAYSQRNHPEFLTYPFATPRNMGKHDLWIAATASLLNLTLVTTDGDFDHLQNVFLDLRKILPEELRPLLQ